VGSFWTGEPVGESVRTPREISLFVVPGERVVRPDGQVLDEEAAADVRREVRPVAKKKLGCRFE
jgi:hypothetical protein